MPQVQDRFEDTLSIAQTISGDVSGSRSRQTLEIQSLARSATTVIVWPMLRNNLELLQSFWNRRSFHDMEINSIRRLRGRVLIELTDYILVLLNVRNFDEKIEEYPTSWIDANIETTAKGAVLHIDAELGVVTVQFSNLRLIDRHDMTILIPLLDR